MSPYNPTYDITYGPDENCTLANCPVQASIFEYRPSLPANAVFIAVFAVSLVLHIYQGVRWRTWAFLFTMFWGCVSEIIGYSGRIIMHSNPFSFPGFLIEIICITLAPAFFSAGIYLTLAKIVVYLDPELSRFAPKYYYWIFIPCDIVSLALQSAGGALSSNSTGSSQSAVDISIGGLSFQVFSLVVFVLLAIDYAIRYLRHRRGREGKPLPARFKAFVAFLSLSIICILMRCIYRIDELSDGYNGPLIHDQGLFIGLEGVLIVVAVFALNCGHPGPVFDGTGSSAATRSDGDGSVEGQSAIAKNY